MIDREDDNSSNVVKAIFNVTWMNDEDILIIVFGKSLILVTDNTQLTRLINLIYSDSDPRDLFIEFCIFRLLLI